MKKLDLEGQILSLLQTSINDIKKTFRSDIAFQPALEIPKERSFGDLTTNAAMKIGHEIRHPAKEIANFLVERINSRLRDSILSTYVRKVEIKGPGFINFHLRDTSLYYVLEQITNLKSRYGRNSLGRGGKLQIEFVSANPTGPLTVAHGRQAAFGDSLANILAYSGYRVTREYYINDEGRQIDLLGESIKASYLELTGEESVYPQDGYRGAYVGDIALMLVKKYGGRKKRAVLNFFADFGCRSILKDIKKDLGIFGVRFEVWYSQKRLRRKGLIQKAFGILKKKDLLYESEGALWFKSSQFGDEKDRVVIKQDGSFTYLAPDIGYHLDKFRRKFERVINIWGPDHHGYIPRIKAAVSGLGVNPESLSCLLVQLVTLCEGKNIVSISTRAGKFIALSDVISEVGRDVARFFFLMRRRDSHLNFDLELAKKESLDNPVYYIQYAYARISSILEYYKSEHGRTGFVKLNASLLKEKEEFHILRILREFPLTIRSCAVNLETYPLLSFLQELAAAFHSFYNKHRVVTADPALTKARVNLVNCVKIVLATGLKLLGVSTPTKM